MAELNETFMNSIAKMTKDINDKIIDDISKEVIDNVDHPKHYKASNGMEVIDVIEEFTENLRGIVATDTGNCIKYILRWHEKNGLEDLKKCQWYLNHVMKRVNMERQVCRIPSGELQVHIADISITFTTNIPKDDMRTLTKSVIMNLLSFAGAVEPYFLIPTKLFLKDLIETVEENETI